MGRERPHIYQPSREEVAQVIYECQAMEQCGDPETSRRLTALRYFLETRRPDELADRVIIAPAPEVPEEP